jgi:hypothetical protein
MSVLSSALVQALQQSHNEPTSPWSESWGRSVNSSMTLDVSLSREDLHDSESDDNIDIHGDVDIDNSSECSDKENVRPVLEEILIPRRNQNTDVDVERHIDAWLDTVGKVMPLLARAAKRASLSTTSRNLSSEQRSQALLHLAAAIQDNIAGFADVWRWSSCTVPVTDEHDRMQD